MRPRNFTLLTAALLLLQFTSQAQSAACWLCHRTSPPATLHSETYTETRSIRHEICDTCAKTKPSCSVCGAPTNAEKERDGRHICPDCKKVAIDTPQEVEALYSEVRTFVENLTGKKVDSRPPIELVQEDELQTRFVEGSGRSFRPHAFYRAYNPELIYVLSGHSAYDLGPTLAHEFTHAWQSRHCPSQDRMVTEGFASWMGYRFAESKNYRDKMAQMMGARDPDYGEGLRQCLAIEKASGVKGLLKFMQTEKAFSVKK